MPTIVSETRCQKSLLSNFKPCLSSVTRGTSGGLLRRQECECRVDKNWFIVLLLAGQNNFTYTAARAEAEGGYESDTEDEDEPSQLASSAPSPTAAALKSAHLVPAAAAAPPPVSELDVSSAAGAETGSRASIGRGVDAAMQLDKGLAAAVAGTVDNVAHKTSRVAQDTAASAANKGRCLTDATVSTSKDAAAAVSDAARSATNAAAYVTADMSRVAADRSAAAANSAASAVAGTALSAARTAASTTKEAARNIKSAASSAVEAANAKGEQAALASGEKAKAAAERLGDSVHDSGQQAFGAVRGAASAVADASVGMAHKLSDTARDAVAGSDSTKRQRVTEPGAAEMDVYRGDSNRETLPFFLQITAISLLSMLKPVEFRNCECQWFLAACHHVAPLPAQPC